MSPEWFLILRMFIVDDAFLVEPTVWGPMTMEQCAQAMNNSIPQIEQKWRQSGLAFEGHSWTLTCENKLPEPAAPRPKPEISTDNGEISGT